jgi:molybdopterin-guanine dinucleotide biosynthesis protein MobB
VFVVAREPGRLRRLGLPVVRDAVDARGSVTGIYTALMASPSERVLCLACDMPMVGPDFLRCLAEGSAGYDAFVPRHGPYEEPLCAVYARAATGEFERLLADGRLQVRRVFSRVRAGYLQVDEERFGKASDLFMNVNTPEELERARRVCAQPPDPLPGQERRLADRVEAFRSRAPMPVVSFVGKKKSGKTSVLLGVIRELVSRGYRVAALKHDSHGFEIDVAGTDSFRLREAGALVAGISSPDKYAWVNQTGREPSLQELAARITEPVDLLITEGFKKQGAPKIEVSRRGRSTELIAEEDELIGIASDQAFPGYRVPQLSLDDFVGIADLVERQIVRGCRAAALPMSHGPAQEMGATARGAAALGVSAADAEGAS